MIGFLHHLFRVLRLLRVTISFHASSPVFFSHGVTELTEEVLTFVSFVISRDNVSPTMILPAAFPPPWAGGWGEDRKGVFAEVVVRGVTMEMRWIPFGRFLMGSSEDEPGWSKDEGPQHGVTLPVGSGSRPRRARRHSERR